MGVAFTSPMSIEPDGQASDAIRQRLKQQRVSVEFEKAKFKDVIDTISNEYRIPIRMRYVDPDHVIFNRATEITCTASYQLLSEVLRKILKPLALTWTIDRGIVFITEPDDEADDMKARFYPVADLVPVGVKHEEARPMETLAVLQSKIRTEVANASWGELGGPGIIRSITNPPALVVVQSESNHASLEEWLRSYREKRKQQATRQD